MSTGPELRDARQRLGWSLRDAERVSGVPNAHINQIETGNFPSVAWRCIGPDGIYVTMDTSSSVEVEPNDPNCGARP